MLLEFGVKVVEENLDSSPKNTMPNGRRGMSLGSFALESLEKIASGACCFALFVAATATIATATDARENEDEPHKTATIVSAKVKENQNSICKKLQHK